MNLSTPDNHRVVVKLNSTLINHFCTLILKALCDQIASHINVSADSSIAATWVGAAKQLRSGDLAIYTHTVAEKEALQANPNWVKAFEACKVIATTYSVIVYRVPVNSIQMNN